MPQDTFLPMPSFRHPPADLIFHARLTLRGITDVLAAATSAAAVTSRQRLATVAAAPQRTESAATAASTDTLHV
eukprot:426088-Pelagomonas_calceolata.AAC.8